MKNIVIAAGYATRLGELTKNFPKPLLKIGNNTILGRMLDDIDTIPEIDEHIIITNHKFAPIFEDWRKERLQTPAINHCSQRFSAGPSASGGSPASSSAPSGFAARSSASTAQGASPASSSGPGGFAARKPITIVDDGNETNDTRLGAVCDLLLAIDKLSDGTLSNSTWPDDLLVVAADNLLFFSFREFVKFAKEKGTSCIMCHEQPSIEKLQRTGVVELDANNRVLGMEEKPEHPKSHWAVPPFYIYLKKDLDLVRHSVENGCGKDAPGNLAHYMVDHTTMHAWPMSAGRFDIGSLDTYYQAVELYGK
jgi:glucose-1-phosphate thymidylyltransferase